MPVRLVQLRIAREVSSVPLFADDPLRRPAPGDDRVELRGPPARRRPRCPRRPRGIRACNRRPPPAPGTGGHRRDSPRRSRATSAGSAGSAGRLAPACRSAACGALGIGVGGAHRQALLAVQPVQLLAVHDHAFAREQSAKAAIAEAASKASARKRARTASSPPRAGRRTVFEPIWTSLQARAATGPVRPSAAAPPACAAGVSRFLRAGP